MTTSIAHKPAHVLREYTQRPRDIAAALRRLEEQYFGALARAETQYVEGINRVMTALLQPTEPEPVMSSNGKSAEPAEPAEASTAAGAA